MAVLFVLACTPEERREAVADLSKTGACVLTAVAEGGIDDPALILQRCAGSTRAEIGALAQEWLDASPPSDAAQATPSAIALHARFVAVRDRAQVMQGDAK